MSRAGHEVYLSLGGNIGPVRKTLGSALRMLDRVDGCRVEQVSDLYVNPAWGGVIQPDYLNCVARLHAALPPLKLLTLCQAIEAAHGRRRLRRWGPRTLDIDIVLMGDARVDDGARLTIPHKMVMQRAFVLMPMIEIEPDIRIAGQSARDALPGLDTAGFRRLGLPPNWWRHLRG